MLLQACAEPLGPQEVADRFWRAVVTQHPGKIKRYVLARQRAALDGEPELLAIAEYGLGRAIIDGDRASIETRVVLAGDTPVPVTIDTRLEREDETWRVDYESTVDEISRQGDLARVIEQIGVIGNALKDGVEQSVDEMSRALPALEQELSRLESEIRQRMPELREKVEDFARRLEDALRSPPPDRPREPPAAPPAADDTIAL